eukprot:SAG25_NODE_28_length_20925_cov_13.342839_16_plen_47_part_00
MLTEIKHSTNIVRVSYFTPPHMVAREVSRTTSLLGAGPKFWSTGAT